MENQLPQGYCREENKKEIEYKNIILTGGGCVNQREYIDGSLNYERVPTDGCLLFRKTHPCNLGSLGLPN